MDDLKVSDSICVNGACLTVTRIEGTTFTVDTVPETLRRTNLGELAAGGSVNLERPMKADGRFGGHVVQGHVDGTGTVVSIEAEGEARQLHVRGAGQRNALCGREGFHSCGRYASLTVVDCDYRTFSVTVIPYTREAHRVRKSETGR